MSRGVALSTLRTLLKAEVRNAQETNTADDTRFNYVLSNNQNELANDYDWPFLEDKWEKSVVANDRYLAVPTTNIRSIASTINFERPVSVTAKFNSFYNPVEYGIGVDEMNAMDSNTTTQDPVQRWSLDTNIGDTTSPNEFEIWPKAAGAQTIRFTGQRAVRTFASDADLSDLDHILIVLFAAAEILIERDSEKAQLTVTKANQRLIKVRAGYPSKVRPAIVFGRVPYYRRENIKLVATA